MKRIFKTAKRLAPVLTVVYRTLQIVVLFITRPPL
jgi:hypothetical protein